MYININVQAVTVTACFTGAALLTLFNCTATNQPVVCQCSDEKMPPALLVKEMSSQPSPVTQSTHRPLEQTHTQPTTVLIITRATRTVAVIEGKQVLAHFPVAVGKPGWETPPGRHQVAEMKINPSWKHPVTGDIIPPGKHNPMGSHWIGFWQNTQGHKVGFHGTNNEASIGSAVSHGCVRMKNSDIMLLYEYVTIGTIVIVQ